MTDPLQRAQEEYVKNLRLKQRVQAQRQEEIKQKKLIEEEKSRQLYENDRIAKEARQKLIKELNPAKKVFEACLNQVENDKEIQNKLLEQIKNSGDKKINLSKLVYQGGESVNGVCSSQIINQLNVTKGEIAQSFSNNGTMSQIVKKGIFMNKYKIVGRSYWTLLMFLIVPVPFKGFEIFLKKRNPVNMYFVKLFSKL
jgi:hypothetical protein